jgi:hypothetical protein
MKALFYTQEMNGNCPIQAEGVTDCGLPWYFCVLGCVSLAVGRTKGVHPLDDTLWEIDDDELPFDSLDYPGWSSHEKCEKWLINALELFAKRA